MIFWTPSIVERRIYARTPPVGELIGYQHRVWRVAEVVPLIPGDWSERARQAWLDAGMPELETWRQRPIDIIVTPPDSDTHHGMQLEPWHADRMWYVVPEHYAVCAHCGDPAPCRDLIDARQAKKEIAAAAKAMELPDGFCPACREPITHRQKAFRFPGENLLNPLGAPGVRFHQRRKCRGAAAAYEEKWVRADPTRQRSLLTLTCKGAVIVHQDGSAECHGAEDCPTIYAQHRSYAACYFQSHGCGRGCGVAGHPGARLRPGLTDTGALP